ncbi:MAG: lipopolysaccharide biosynthesis protein [Polyangiaceae bacterium]
MTETSSANTRGPLDSPPASEPRSTESVATNAGRGGLAVAVAKLYFLVVGLVQQILLTRVLGTAGYGALSTALSISAVVYNPIVTTSIQGVSRTVAQCEENEKPSAIRRVLLIHAKVAVPIAVLFFIFAGPIVHTVHAPHLVGSVRVLALVLLCYGLYAPLIGIFNGRRKFVWQAGFDMAYATMRTALMVGGAFLFARLYDRGVLGASLGFACASALIALAALPLAGVGRRGDTGPRMREYLVFVGPVFVGQVLLNLLQQADLTVLRYFAASSAIAAGLAPERADALVGAYRATQLFCFLPYQLLLSITFVLFPLLAKAHRDRNHTDVRLFVMTGIRLAVIISGLMVSVISGLSGPLLRLVFPLDVAIYATQSMQLLALGFGAFAIFGILTTVLTSLEQERTSAAITGLAFLLVSVLGVALLRARPFDASLLFRTAIATSTGLLLATLIAAHRVHRHAGGVVSVLTLARGVCAIAVTVLLGRLWSPQGKLVTLAAAAVLGALYLGLLVAFRELTSKDLGQVRAVLRGKRAK